MRIRLTGLKQAHRETLKALATALASKDPDTYRHSERVVSYSLRLGLECLLSNRDLKALEYGAFLHDIGKIGIPDSILRKPGRLTEEEWVVMREHPIRGKEMLSDIEFLQGAERVVAQHHEKWDGSGYPLGLCGEEIDLCARIFAVADTYDAITSDRVYKRAQTHAEAWEELIRLSGIHFDPAVIKALCRIPTHEWLRLGSAEQKPTPMFGYDNVIARIPLDRFLRE